LTDGEAGNTDITSFAVGDSWVSKQKEKLFDLNMGFGSVHLHVLRRILYAFLL